MRKIIFFSGLILLLNNYAFATLQDFNNLTKGATVSGTGVFDDFILEGHSGELYLDSGVFGSNINDMSVFNKGCDSWSGCSMERLTIEFLTAPVNLVSFDIRGLRGDDFGMTVSTFDGKYDRLDSDGAFIAPPGWYDGHPGYDDVRYVDYWDLTTGNWVVNFTIIGKGIKFVDLVYYPLELDISFDNFTYSPAPVPEPATIFLFGIGVAGLVVARRRKKKA